MDGWSFKRLVLTLDGINEILNGCSSRTIRNSNAKLPLFINLLRPLDGVL